MDGSGISLGLRAPKVYDDLLGESGSRARGGNEAGGTGVDHDPTTGIELSTAMAEAIRDGVMGRAHRAGPVAREHGQPGFSRAVARRRG
ncbi:hypothetical protein [Amycolatopsis sp. cmx-4-54]|uniref:hypothetical protein n=1 Tax=Amycolatopsis sp. cmx-4-54 TaxID=2790936 RepID=UPI00397B9093